MTSAHCSTPDHASVPAPEREPVYQLLKRAEINPADVEDASAHAVEVTVLWERSVLHVAHLEGPAGFTLASHAAPGDATRFVLDAAVLGGDEAPVVVRDGDAARFVIAPGARGEVEIDGARRDLASLVATGLARPSASVPGAHEVNIVAGGRYRAELAGLTVQARLVPAGRRFAHVTRKDPALRLAWAGSALAVAAMLGVMRLASRDTALLSAEDHDARLAELRDFVARQSEQAQTVPEAQEAAAVAAPAGAAHQGAAGAMGSRQATARNHRYDIRRTGERPQVARELSAREQVAARGIFAAMGRTPTDGGSRSGIVSPWGAMTEAGTGERDANGNINGADVGDSVGWDGLDTVSTGVGGGGHEQGIGTGPLGTHGHGDCRPGEVCAPGARRGTELGPRRSNGPTATPRTPTVEGTIAPEAIRRVVLRNIGQVNRCYEQGLAVNPSASGRVAVRFVIAAGGAVLAAGVAEDELRMPSVASCITTAVRRWNFPVPESSGPVTVTYPFSLMPADP